MEGQDWKNGNHHSGDDVAMKVQPGESLWEMASKVYGPGKVPLAAVCEENGLLPEVKVDAHGKRSFLPPVVQAGETLYFPAPDRVKELTDDFKADLKGGKPHGAEPFQPDDLEVKHSSESLDRLGEIIKAPFKLVMDAGLAISDAFAGLCDANCAIDKRAADGLRDTPLGGLAEGIYDVNRFLTGIFDGSADVSERVADKIGIGLPKDETDRLEKVAQPVPTKLIEYPSDERTGRALPGNYESDRPASHAAHPQHPSSHHHGHPHPHRHVAEPVISDANVPHPMPHLPEADQLRDFMPLNPVKHWWEADVPRNDMPPILVRHPRAENLPYFIPELELDSQLQA